MVGLPCVPAAGSSGGKAGDGGLGQGLRLAVGDEHLDELAASQAFGEAAAY